MTHASMAAQTVLVVVFAVSLTSKLRNRAAWSGFVVSVRQLGQIPGPLADASAAVVAAAELLVVGLLLAQVTLLGLALAAVLLTAFSWVLLSARRRGVATPCRCFGASTAPPGIRQLVRNLLLLSLVGLAAVAGATGTEPVAPAGLLVAVVVGVVVAAVLILLDEFVELFVGPAAGARVADRRGL